MDTFPAIWIPGHPRTKGSFTPVKSGPFTKLRPAGKYTQAWCAHAKAVLLERWKHEILEGPVSVEFTFLLPKPKTVTRAQPTGRYDGDVDKLIRAIMDSATGIVYLDDSQVTTIERARKRWATAPEDCGVWVTFSRDDE